jgi:hypothetical protein
MAKTFLVLGAGSRGFTYGEYALAFPTKLKLSEWLNRGMNTGTDSFRNMI